MLTWKNHFSRLLALALPLSMSQAGAMAVAFVDNVMVGRVGTSELAASSFANSVVIVLFILGSGILMGITPMVGFYEGKNDTNAAALVVKSSYPLSLLVNIFVVVCGGIVFFLLPYMGQPETVLQLSRPYYLIVLLSFIPYLIFHQFKQIGEGLGNTMIAMKAAVAGNVLNVVFNYVFIFGKLGVPAMGLNGAALGTLLSRIVMPVLLLVNFRTFDAFTIVSSAGKTMKSSVTAVKDILKVGSPIAGQMLLEVSMFTAGTIMIGWLGEVPLAGHQIAISYCSFTFLVITGFGMAATIRVSRARGREEPDHVFRAAVSAIAAGVGFMSVTGIVFFTFRRPLAQLFTTDLQVIDEAVPLLVVAACFQLLDAVQAIGLGVLRGLQDVTAPMIIAAVSYIGIGLPVGYYLGIVSGMGTVGIWIGFITGLILASILYCHRIFRSNSLLYT